MLRRGREDIRTERASASPHGRAAEGRSVWNRHPLARRTRISQRPRVRPSATSYSPRSCRPGQPPTPPPERRKEIRYGRLLCPTSIAKGSAVQIVLALLSCELVKNNRRRGKANGYPEWREPSRHLGRPLRSRARASQPQARVDDEAVRPASLIPQLVNTKMAIEQLQKQQRLLIRRLWQQRPSCLKPIHCSITCDKHAGETFANVLTSLPFIILGLHTPRKNLNAAIYANSLVGVGIASGLYHSSKGEVRKILRWADYTMIATTTLCLSRAVRNENPGLLMAASTLLLPFQPFMVSAVHTGMMEVSFAKRASVEPELRMVHNLHKMSSLLGGALFIADDYFPETPYIHAAWHLAAAMGIGTCNKLLG